MPDSCCSETVQDFYQYNTPFFFSANTGLEVSTVTQSFVVKELNGTEVVYALVTIHDIPQNGHFGSLYLSVTSEGETGNAVDLLVMDDPNEGVPCA